MAELIVLCGLQASGKTSFYMTRFAGTHIRLSLDMLGRRDREETLLAACLDSDQPVVIDNVNATRRERLRYIDAARQRGWKVCGYHFPLRLAEALRRNDRRTDKPPVDAAAIRGCAGRFERPVPDEGYHSLWFVHLSPSGGFRISETMTTAGGPV